MAKGKVSKAAQIVQADPLFRDCLRIAAHGLGAAMLGLAVIDEARHQVMANRPKAVFLPLPELRDLACQKNSAGIAFLRTAIAVDPGSRSGEVGKVLALANGEQSAIAVMSKPRENYGSL